MDYKVSALKYRPNEFSKVIGQNHVTDTLKNSIKENKIPSAIFFADQKELVKQHVQEFMLVKSIKNLYN